MDEPLVGRHALVTGGGRGIGRSIALALARAGADVAVAARTREQIEAVAGEIRALGRRAVAVDIDLTLRDQIDKGVKQAAEQLGGAARSWSTTPAGPLAMIPLSSTR